MGLRGDIMSDKFEFVDVETLDEKSDDKADNSSLTEKEKPIVDISKRFYFSFEARIIVSIIVILLLFVGACFLALKVINHTTTQKVNYQETCDFSYQVCLKDSTCLPENSKYKAEDINIIKVAFKYNATYDKKIDVENKYRVNTIISAYDKKDHGVVYRKDINMVESTKIQNVSNSYTASEVVTYQYPVYYDYTFKDYPNTDNEVELAFYVEEKNETRKVASLVIPYSKETFELVKYDTDSNRNIDVKVNVWDSYTLIYGIFASILTLVSLILIYRTTRLVLKVTNNKNEFEEEVDSILKEYDSIIIVARDGYESIIERETVKLDSFEELVKIRDEINKPIIFSRVNNVKCEFILESDDKLYKYVMKEADLVEDDKNKLENK